MVENECIYIVCVCRYSKNIHVVYIFPHLSFSIIYSFWVYFLFVNFNIISYLYLYIVACVCLNVSELMARRDENYKTVPFPFLQTTTSKPISNGFMLEKCTCTFADVWIFAVILFHRPVVCLFCVCPPWCSTAITPPKNSFFSFTLLFYFYVAVAH